MKLHNNKHAENFKAFLEQKRNNQLEKAEAKSLKQKKVSPSGALIEVYHEDGKKKQGLSESRQEKFIRQKSIALGVMGLVSLHLFLVVYI